MEEIKAKIRKHALQNAVRYEKPPKKDAVLKKMLAEHPELRKDAKQLSTLVKEEIKRITSMSKEERVEELTRIAPEVVEAVKEKEKEKEKREAGLPELPLSGSGGVVIRFAPNPNGAATLGSARGIIVNSAYAKKYKGKFILRFDDTDPVLKRPLLEAYDWYLEDCEWLDARPDEVVVASERMTLYYNYAAELIEKGAAYVCFCPAETFKTYKEHKRPCPHRAVRVETNEENWAKMLTGVYEEKEAVLRIKTSMAGENPALYDWVAFRILKREHPRIGKKYVVWPTLDFESAIEDHVLGITHIIRGKDLMNSEKRQRFLYEHLGWNYPETMLWGKIKMQEFGKFSTSELRRAIERGEYEGWDDPRLPTLKALRRRGFQPDALRKFFISLGITQTDIAVSMKNLYAENRKVVDARASRYFFTRSPRALKLRNGSSFVAEALKHPSRDEFREIRTGSTVYVSVDDFATMKEGQQIRLKYLCSVQIESIRPLVASVLKNPAEDIPIIHWAPSEGIKVTVKKPEGIDEGIGEPLIASELGNVVQFERYGFVRVDSVVGKEVVAYFTH
jgi:glutamyl-tRNA synthetase